MTEGLRQMAKFLSNQGLAAIKTSDGGLKPIVVQYFQTALKPALGAKIGLRTDREMTTCAEAIDLLLAGDTLQAAEVLLQRFKALEVYSSTGSWDHARHLELTRPDAVSSISTRELELAHATELMENKLKRPSRTGPLARDSAGSIVRFAIVRRHPLLERSRSVFDLPWHVGGYLHLRR